MKRMLLCLGVVFVMAMGLRTAVAADAGSGAINQRHAVLVELFTSEGCSSCPPADALLERLDRDQPWAGVEIVALSEHVDYWNHIGWADPYSSAAFSERQSQYVRRLGLGGPYTPQMVVDGTAEFVGSDAPKAEAAIRSAARTPGIAIRVAAAGGASGVALTVDPLPAGKIHRADVYLALAADSGTSDVLRGENEGRRLHHISIVKQIRQVGTISDRAGLHTTIPLGKDAAPAGSRVIAFVQEPDYGRVWGAALWRVPR